MKKYIVLFIMISLMLACSYVIGTINHPRTWLAIIGFIIISMIIINKFINQSKPKQILTAADFNEKYRDYLEEGHYGLSLDKHEAVEYLDEQFQELIKTPGFKYSQIKCKFNSFRFYADGIDLFKIREIEERLGEIYGLDSIKPSIY